MRIGKVAARAGVNVETLRYERRGLRPEPARSAANQSMEEAAFLGDTWCFLVLCELAEGELVAPLAGAKSHCRRPRATTATSRRPSSS
jgi:hypothetical protein